ncbi:MAG: restriction endonuclease subunit S [Acidobacteria bacterium]|nr:restriction endonuclease subunit S [Acidobacteriota bacterium]
MITLGALCSFLNGGTPSRRVARYYQGDVPWITGADISGPRVDTARSFITEEAISHSATNRVPAGTVLLVTRTSVGKVALTPRELCFSQDITAITPDPNLLDTSYLVHFLRTKQPHLERLARGATIKGVTREAVANLAIPLPPLAEQERIAGILDAADALRARRREALNQFDALLQSTFLDMFGDPVTNPMRWRVGRLDNYFSKTRPGTCCGPFGSALKKREYVEDGIPVWGIDNVKPNQFVQERSLFITPTKFAQLRRYSVEPGDILISRAGTVGRMCVAVPTVEESIIGSNLIRLSLDQSAMLPVYFASLYTFCGERLPGLRASGDENAYSFLNTTRLKSLVVPLPPLDVQRRFAAIVESIREQRIRHRAHLAELDILFASLQSRAFRGDL